MPTTKPIVLPNETMGVIPKIVVIDIIIVVVVLCFSKIELMIPVFHHLQAIGTCQQVYPCEM